MTRDDVIRMAREAGFPSMSIDNISDTDYARLSRFASLVAADEREACAQIAESEPCLTYAPQRIALHIRTRNNK